MIADVLVDPDALLPNEEPIYNAEGVDTEALRAEAKALFGEIISIAGSPRLPIVSGEDGQTVYDGHGHDYVIGRDSDYLSCNPSIVLVNSELLNSTQQSVEGFSGFEFEEKAGGQVGAANSAHGVFFGFIRAVTSPALILLLSLKRQDVVAWLSFFTLLILALTIIPFVNNFGIVGAGLSSVLASAVMLPFTYVLAFRYLKVNNYGKSK